MPLANKALPKASLETDARSQLLRSARASKGLAEACTPLSPVSSVLGQLFWATNSISYVPIIGIFQYLLGCRSHNSNGLNALVDTEPVFLSDLQHQISTFHHQLYPFPARDTGWAVNPRLLACFMTMAWRPLNHNSVSFCRRQFGDWKGRPMFLGNYLDVIAIGRGIPISGFTFYIKKHLTS